jgi:branched-chain amino acid transport system substrate-binding protein
MKMPEAESFLTKYQAKAASLGIDQLGLYLPPYAYAGAQIYGEAIKAVGSLDQTKLAAYIHSHKFQTIVGEIEFAPNGEWAKARILQTQFRDIKDSSLDTFKKPGAQIILYPPQYKSGDVIPYDQAKK